MIMKLMDFLDVFAETQPIVLVAGQGHGTSTIQLKNKNDVPIEFLEYNITYIAYGKDGLVVYVQIPYARFKDLDIISKTNAIYGFVNYINGMDEYNGFDNMRQMEDYVYEFLEEHDYHIDAYGNWYDADNNIICE